MPDVTLARARWRVLQTIHPLFLLAETLPTPKDVDQGCYGSLSVDKGDHLKNEITTLRTDLRLNIIRQQQIDIEELENDDPNVEWLESSLQTLLEDLEDLIDSEILQVEGLEVSLV